MDGSSDIVIATLLHPLLEAIAQHDGDRIE
jgi:hypothetical protein